MKIHARRALVSGKWMQDCVVEIENGAICAVSRGSTGDLSVDTLTPGLFDKHLHGALGFDCKEPDEARCGEWLRMLLKHGITDILYTVSTDSIERMQRGVEFAARIMRAQADGGMPGACVQGVHLEGPFINPLRKGAMDEQYILAPALETYEEIVGGNAGIIRAITMAPEMSGALELARLLADRGVRVQVGHTDADYECMDAAAGSGFSGLTHTFNAMSPIGHRKPGPAVFGIVDDRFCIEAICDGVHLDLAVVKLLLRAKGASGVAMVSDSAVTAGLPDGEYVHGGRYVRVADGCNYTRTGGIAGSWNQLDAGVTNLVNAGIPMEDAIRAASTTPAAYLKLAHQLGNIAPRRPAHLAAWDAQAQCIWGYNGCFSD